MAALPVDRIDAMGVPGETSGWDYEDDYRPKPPEPRATLAGLLRLVEHRPTLAGPQRVMGQVFTGPICGASAQRAMQAARGVMQLSTAWKVWSWPDGLQLPIGRLREGIAAVAALPAENSRLDLGAGVAWQVQQFPPMTSAPPDFLFAELQKFGGED